MTPSYRNGFYAPRRGGRAKYPELWDGCVGAWAPLLGVTGSKLMDQSAYQRIAVLINGPIWEVQNGQQSIVTAITSSQYLNSNSFFTPELVANNSHLTLYARTSFTSDAVNQNFLAERGVNSGFSFFRTNNTTLGLVFYGVVSYSKSISTTAGRVYDLAVTYDRENIRFYLDGVLMSTQAETRAISNTANLGTFLIGASYTDAGVTVGAWSGLELQDARIYKRALSQKEIKLLATRRGIAYETLRRKSYFILSSSPSEAATKRLTITNVTCPWRMIASPPNGLTSAGDRRTNGFLYYGNDASSSSSGFYSIFRPSIFRGVR